MKTSKTKQLCVFPEQVLFEHHDYFHQLFKDQTSGEMSSGLLERWRSVLALQIFLNTTYVLSDQMMDFINENF